MLRLHRTSLLNVGFEAGIARTETRKANKKLRKICLGKLSDEAGRTTLRESVYYLTLFKSRGLSNARPHGRNKRVESPCALRCCACGTKVSAKMYAGPYRGAVIELRVD